MGSRRSSSDQNIDARALCQWALRAAFGVALLWLWHPAVAGAASEIGNVYIVRHLAYGAAPAQSRAEMSRSKLKIDVIDKSYVQRLETGQMKLSGMPVVTPVANITPIGIEFITPALASGVTTASVISGAMTITLLVPTSGSVTNSEPETVRISGSRVKQRGAGFHLFRGSVSQDSLRPTNRRK